MTDPALPFQQFQKEKDFLVGIDSDGCAFDTMDSKMKQCIIPRIIADWGLEAIAGLVRETTEFVNLYSKWRGMNRFPALVKVFDLLAERAEIAAGGFDLPEIASLRDWVARETQLSNRTLEKAVRETGDPVLARVLQWARHINGDMARIVRGSPAFRFVRESLEKMVPLADIAVISTATNEYLAREWGEHGYAKYVKALAGQEAGGKKEILALAIGKGYAAAHVLMIGDARGDLLAAQANQALYYPIIPGREEESWQHFYGEAFERFVSGRYAGAYQAKLIAAFQQCLPEKPPWLK